ncbi:alcohol dehydrogenase [Methyloprofundus sedimenti]|uniref:alcohol dehydrogenase (NADP(+)) n=1 Tax=Methyloprofundus sedimenti TaxID=1420851 RepID=A0A1V8M5H8_9GAMM|nr:NAD(P)-dependent alcohol dehydrogenase [Methyloprofundus sedimenti]OQK16814.1 alcohol dehydrogenase [Methyloprofundus sedimenti]
MTEIQAWASHGPKQKLERFAFNPGALDPEGVEIAVEYCGLCHSDLSIINNDWGISQYPVVPGHEAIGRVIAIGNQVKGVHVGQYVGIGWNSGSCMHCHQCMGGNNNLCSTLQPTIVGHHGGFSQRLRAHWAWVIPLPDSLDIASAGPLLCGGVTVFSPLLTFDVKPTDHVGIVGIGGLGHMGLKFAKAWGCEVSAFTSHESKTAEAISFGAHHVISSQDTTAMLQASNTLDMLIVTVNVALDWASLLKTLKPNGRLHVVGAVLDPMPISAFDLISGQKSISGSPTGSSVDLTTMLKFAARHDIRPQVEHFPMSRVNDALEHLASGKARYRIVLDTDFS